MGGMEAHYNLTSFEYFNLIKNHHHNFFVLKVFGLLAASLVICGNCGHLEIIFLNTYMFFLIVGGLFFSFIS